MQNEFGCIKIGRSVDPWQRRHTIASTAHCSVVLIAAFEGGGEDEEAIHIELDEFRLEGEWFDGTDAARAAIQGIFSAVPLEWKFAHDPDRANKWLDHFRVLQNASYTRNAVTRQIGILRDGKEPSWVYDGGVFWARHLALTGEWTMVDTVSVKGKTTNGWHNPETGKREVLPAYTSSVEEALLAWPDELRPANWEGTPFECCIAALIAIRAGLPKVQRPPQDEG